MSKIGATAPASSPKAISYHKKDICTICVQLLEDRTKPQKMLKNITLTSQDHLERGLAWPTSNPWDEVKAPVDSDATRSIRRTIDALKAHLNATRQAAKRKEHPTDGDEVDRSQQKRARRTPSHEHLESDELESQGSSRVETTNTSDSEINEVSCSSGTTKTTHVSSSSGKGNCIDRSVSPAANLAAGNIASTSAATEADIDFRLSTADKKRFLDFVSRKEVTAARQLIPADESIMVIKGAKKVADFAKEHGFDVPRRKEGGAPTELHVCQMKVWVKGGRVKYDRRPCYLSGIQGEVKKSLFMTHDNIVRHHKEVHFGLERPKKKKKGEEEEKVEETTTKTAPGKGKKRRDNDDADYTGSA